ncbi:MAG: Fe(3+) ABC transporter substrate-binding protein [Flammeovirgaceae bacterium]|nr:Fe(3+) ABC transporter substrate-binding protein [Flammeovirgaceae bacterium]|tara:strand:+ start:62 stop:1108 length:1047 start_codon:yes stop_codon:yes gene_type:complete
MKKYSIVIFYLMVLLLNSCSSSSNKEKFQETQQEINVYTHRHYAPDKELFAQFEKELDIKVNVVNANADELILKMENEGEKSPADVLITVDAGRLERAKEKNLLQPINSEVLTSNVPKHLRDVDGHWFGLTKRSRVIVYAKDRVTKDQLSTYEALTEDQWMGKILIRSSGNIYNQSLMASMIANLGEEVAAQWAAGILKNMARSPKGSDRDQMKAVAAGVGDLAIVNTYYVGKLLNSPDSLERRVGQQMGIFFPNQEGRGAHINVSGAGVAKYSPNKANAIKFIEFLSSEAAQEIFSSSNFEYPVNPIVKISPLLQSWGTFKEDKLSLSNLGVLNKSAVLLFDQVGWK